VAEEPIFIVLVAVNVVLGVYGGWQLVRGWQLQRRGTDEKRLMMAGAAKLLLSSGMWVVIFLFTAWSHRLGPMTGRIGLGLCMALVLFSVVVDHRRKQLVRQDIQS
jgi:hypothetical protein